MPNKGPHISIAPEHLLSRILGLSPDDFDLWPEDVRDLALTMAQELFLVRYNPFIDPGMVRSNVQEAFAKAKRSLSLEYASVLTAGISRFWRDWEEDQAVRREIVSRLSRLMPAQCIDTRPNSLVESSTDATDLRMELPLLVVSPETAEQIQAVVRLALEMDFAIVPRGGGSGLTGGAIPAKRRMVVLSLSKLKKIISVDPEAQTICAEAGVITLDAIKAAAAKDLLFTVDPASKAASSIGGNVSENSGGPFAFEYGTTLDNILSYRMVLPTGEFIEVRRENHPRHKIMEHETATFTVLGEDGRVTDVIELSGRQIRGAGLGKDVTNKYLGGLPGVQKEGVDGIITEACFTCFPVQRHSRTMCLEFYGRSMRNAMLVIKDLIAMRDKIREEGDLVKMSALEEFGVKYVQAIEYEKKSTQYEGDPISVLLLQFDSNDETALDAAVEATLAICQPYDGVDIFAARDDREAEVFWEDRHKLSAISRRTSGFKINEDVVIPTDVIPEFSDFLEQLNLHFMARAYRTALDRVGLMPGVAVDDEFIEMERDFTTRILTKNSDISAKDLSDQELEVQAYYFFKDLCSRYPRLEKQLAKIHERMLATRIVIANHMHAGDGNCHVNLPVNSNDPEMILLAEEAAEMVFTKVIELKGEVTGEHGIGITKIGFLSDKKIEALRHYKKQVDPWNLLNPGKLTSRQLTVKPYTFSFNRLIQDIAKTGLPDKERLINLLTNIQVCNRCGKCKQVCPMYYPQQSLLYHPRNRNISLGALIEAIYYTQVNSGEPDKSLLDELRRLLEHCTGCGKCTAACPVKIKTSEVTLQIRAFLEDKGSGGHPLKSKVLGYLSHAPERRVPMAAKAAGIGQSVQNRALKFVPPSWRDRFENPLFKGPGPLTGFKNVTETLHLDRSSIFAPRGQEEGGDAVLYFPGCGGGLFFRDIAMAGLMLLLEAGVTVVMPREHLCCGYPLIVSGCEGAFNANRERSSEKLRTLLTDARTEGINVSSVLTACGSCRDGLSRWELGSYLGTKLDHQDVVQYVMNRLDRSVLERANFDERLVYHASCHAEWAGIAPTKAAGAYATALNELTGAAIHHSPGCCGESGMGAMTSPAIYNKLRHRKKGQLEKDLEIEGLAEESPIIVGCPSCKIGIKRGLIEMKRERPVLHTLEYLARAMHGDNWRNRFRQAANSAAARGTVVRKVGMTDE